jgi:hypothetical protein
VTRLQVLRGRAKTLRYFLTYPVIAIVILVVIYAFAASWGKSGTGSGSTGPLTSSPPTVKVFVGDISEVITLTGTVVPAPDFTIDASRIGTVVETANLTASSHVAAGTILFRQGGQVIRTPVAATIVSWLVPSMSPVAANLPIVLLRYSGFGMVASLSASDSYRILAGALTARAEISNGPGPFDCSVVSSATNTTSTSGSSYLTTPSLTCLVPLSVTAFSGLGGLMSMTSGRAMNSLLLPTTAVAGTVGQGQVSVVSAGKVHVVTVELGVTNGGVVQIKSGLRLGETVLATSPAISG